MEARAPRWWTPSEVLLVEDELDVGLGVGQALFLQGSSQLRGAAEEHPHFGSFGKRHIILGKLEGGGGAPPSPGPAPHLGCCDAMLANSLSQLGFP